MARMLRVDPAAIGRLGERAPPWFATFRPGHAVGEPEPLFPRIEVPKA
jgi:hypothetical protein